MTFDELASDLLSAAKMLRGCHPRSSASRAYYAAHIALAKVLTREGFKPPRGYETQEHRRQSKLIGQYLNTLGDSKVKELRKLYSRLYSRRIDADYVKGVTVNEDTAISSIRDAIAVLIILNGSEMI